MPAGLTVYDVIAISGHRDYPDPAAFYKGLDNLRAREYVFGGARGADTDALKYIARTQPNAVRTVVVPNRVMDQPYTARAAIKLHSTNTIELRNKGFNRYQIRNEFMVNRANHTRAFYDFRGRGGTYNTINYCRANNKSYDIWSVKKFDQEAIMKKNKNDFDAWLRDKRNMRVNPSSVKRIVLEYLKQNLRMGMYEYLLSIGVVGVKTFEEYFRAWHEIEQLTK